MNEYRYFFNLFIKKIKINATVSHLKSFSHQELTESDVPCDDKMISENNLD